ncbi:non-ribosomal peptide synthetase [Aliikangiella coralliicola]|uniref:Amino acid adenylation domain-containing protein n=1 Tax=Aliikangiella coralliicola TaxID=2592383 RepID=A0A545TV41_9GAMM|nr:non-ribosomal peptide synthetase [Aliikangiella coralliicola]TQV81088.1 amino acid adenylation domain-containing protein [Aliikangiella coralliicola]
MDNVFPASPQQTRLWKIVKKGTGAFPFSQLLILFERQLDSSKLSECFEFLFEQYEIFKTRLICPQGETEPFQKIIERGEFKVEHYDKFSRATLQELLNSGDIQPDFSQSPPFEPSLQLQFYRVEDGSTVLAITAPAYIADTLTLKNLLEEASSLYLEYPLNDPLAKKDTQEVLQYADLAQWQIELLSCDEALQERSLFRDRNLSTKTPDKIPFDKGYDTEDLLRIDRFDIDLPEQLHSKSKSLSKNDCVVLWSLFLLKLGQFSKLSVGFSFSGRITDELKTSCGAFSKTIPVVINTFGNTSFDDAKQDILLDYEEISDIQEYFSWDILENTSVKGLVFSPYAFEYSELYQDAFTADMNARVLRTTSTAEPFSLKLSIQENIDSLSFSLIFNKDSFELSDIELLSSRFVRVLSQILLEAEGKNHTLNLISREETDKQIEQWNRTSQQPQPFDSYHCWFEHQSALTPNAIALEHNGIELTYKALNEKANQLAFYLQSIGLKAGEIVGICMHRNSEMVVALLGVLKAGGAYLPLDISYPRARLRYMINDAAVTKIFVSNELSSIVVEPDAQLNFLMWDQVEADCASMAKTNPANQIKPQDTIYLIYTSGSTGKPKGTVITHESVLNYISHAITNYKIAEGKGSLVHSSISFDLTVTSLLCPLVIGQRAILIKEKDGIEGLIQFLSTGDDYSLLKLTPSHLEVLNSRLSHEAMSNCVRTIVIGGESLLVRQIKPWITYATNTRLFNEYGPTEATVGCCVEQIDPLEYDFVNSGFESSVFDNNNYKSNRSVAIGRPISNTRLYVLDDLGKVVPIGNSGELHIAGTGLAKGYLNNSTATNEAFLSKIVAAGKEPERLYRTGDIVRFRSDGRLEFQGRLDYQVKINGYRVELGEVESSILQLSGVDRVCVTTRSADDVANTAKQLVAYIVREKEIEHIGFSHKELEQLKQELLKILPDYMVPDLWVSLDDLPLNAHGKVAIEELPDPAQRRVYIEPVTAEEIVLCNIWESVLNRGKNDAQPIGVEDNYFAAGGDSIRSIQVIALAKKENIEFNIEQMFSFPTIRSLLKNLSKNSLSKNNLSEAESEDKKHEGYSPFSLISEADKQRVPKGIEDAYPITVLQGGMIYHNEIDAKATSVYHDIFSYRLRCKVDFSIMERVARELCLRHQVLRTTFDLSSFSEPLQLVHREPARIIEFEDISEQTATRQNEIIQDWITNEKSRGFNIGQPPLARFYVHKRGKDLIQFTLSFHHSIIDGWSDATMLSELFIQYLNLVEGEPFDIPKPEKQFYEYVKLEKEAIDNQEFSDYWRESVIDNFEFTKLPKNISDGNESVVHVQPVNIDLVLSDQIKALSSKINVPVKNILLAAHLRVLSFLSNQSDVTTCMVSSGRLETEEGDKILGLFINSIPMRIKLTGDTWANLAKNVFELEKKSLPFRRFPLGKMREMNNGNPISDSLFYYTHYHIFDKAFEAGELEFQELIPHEVSSFPFVGNFHIDPMTDRVHCSLACSGKCFSKLAVQEFSLMYQNTLENMVNQPEGKYLNAQLLDNATQKKILSDACGPTNDKLNYVRVDKQFERAAAQFPEKIALKVKNEQYTYQQLEQMSNAFAHYLLSTGVKSNDSIGVCLDRSEKMIVSLLAILKIGAHYVPFDLGLPRNRVLNITESVSLSCMLTLSSNASELEGVTSNIISLDQSWEEILGHSAEPIQQEHSIDDLCYIIFTSGSTGKPKGVRITQKSVSNFLAAMDLEIGEAKPEDSWLALTNLSFDISVLEIFWSITRGLTLVLQTIEDSKLVSSPTSKKRSGRCPKFSLFYFAADSNSVNPGSEKYELLLGGSGFADDNDFEAVWIPERHFHSFGGLYPNPAILAAAVASTTNKVHIRSGSVVLPIHDPIRVAEEWSVVDNLSNGRIGLSLASGWHANDFVFAPENYEKRIEVLRSGLSFIHRLWSGEKQVIERSNKEFEVELFPKPVQSKLPFWFTAAGNPATFEAAGAAGANVLTHFLGQSEEDLMEKIRLYRAAREKAGYDPDSGQVSLMIHTFVWDDTDEIKDIVQEPLINYLRNSVGLAKSLLSNLEMTESLSTEDLGEVLKFGFERYYNQSGLFGTPTQCAQKIDRLTTLGVDEVCCLIDFGIETDKVMRGLEFLNKAKTILKAEESIQVDYSITAQIKRHNITHIQMTPGLAASIAKQENALQALSGIKKMLVGGESLPQSLADRLQQTLPPKTLMNMYGPTEATIWSTVKQFESANDTVTIGKPILNTTAYILGQEMQLLPRDVYGDLYLGGDGIADGYQNLKEQTRRRFKRNPFSPDPESRLYMTGDVARLKQNGEIEFLNRADNQIKLRGYRIEPGDIEAVLNNHVSISESVVLPYFDEDNSLISGLVGYLIVKPGVEFIERDVRQYLVQELPEYMRPTIIQTIDVFPKTANGKLDRNAFPAPRLTATNKNLVRTEASSDVVTLIASIWAEVLKRAEMQPHDNFFELGGFSIQASQAIAQMRKVFRLEIPLKSLFEAPTPASFALFISSFSLNKKSGFASIEKRANSSPCEILSASQQGIWFADELSGNRSIYNEPAVIKISGDLDVDILCKSFDELVKVHQTLRLKFFIDNNVPVQQVGEYKPFDIEVIAKNDTQDWLRLAEDAVRKPFNLSDGYLARAILIPLDKDTHILALVLHHLISDGWSLRVLLQDLTRVYQSIKANSKAQLEVPQIEYLDYVSWQNKLVESGAFNESLDYWQERLRNHRKTDLIVPDNERGRIREYKGETEFFEFDIDLSKKLKTVSKEHRVTLFITLMTLFKTLLYARSGNREIVVGTDTANRSRVETERLIGIFVNQLVLKTDFSAESTMSEMLETIRENFLEGSLHQDAPYELIIDRVLSNKVRSEASIFQVKFVFQDNALSEFSFDQLKFQPVDIIRGTSKFEFLLNAIDSDEGIKFSVEYDSNLFEQSTILNIIQQYRLLANLLVSGTEQRLSYYVDIIKNEADKSKKGEVEKFQNSKAELLKGIRKGSLKNKNL